MRTPGPASPAGDRRLGLAYCLLTAAGLYTHYAFGFVVLAQNVAALGGLLAHRKGAGAGGLRLAAWIGWQALALVLYLPWLFTALRQLSTWPAAREIQSLGAAVGDLARYLFFGRTLPTAAAWAGLAGALVLLLFALRRRGQNITPLLWLLVPAALTLGFGLLSEPFAKFLLVAVPAGCLLLGQGLAALPARASQPGQRRSPRRLARELGLLALWLAALGALSGGTYASLNNLYFNPAYFRDDYRGIARYVAGIARPGDALITIAPNQVEALGHYHTSGAPIYPLPHTRPLDPAETETALANIAARHARLFVLYWGDAQADPEHRVEKWLNTHTFKAGDTWYGQVRLATYATATPAAAPSTLSGAQFGQPGQAITLEGYTLPEAALAPGDILQVTLFWRADKPIEERYKVFVHLYTDPNQPPVAQQDSEPGGGLAPTNGWLPGQTIADNHGLLIPADAPPGQYSVSLGLYELFTDVRLPVTLEQAEAGDRLSLGTLTLR